MKKILKNRIFIFVLGGITFLSIGIYATNTYNSNSVLYTTSDGESMSVNEALNDLYENKCSSETEEYIFDYTGSEQSFTVSKTGTYKLETWGAQGGTRGSYIGGYGGYSIGEIELQKGDILYINVGGQGGSNSSVTNVGGYNGGGYSGNNSGAQSYGGGGATHIATKSGLLSTLSYSIDSILIVSGGGGGATSGSSTSGGCGGGVEGCNGSASNSDWNSSTYIPKGGTQTGAGYAWSGANSTRQGAFGTGKTSNTNGWGGGGGGGFYGGGNGHGTTGSGGSGYIGNSLLTNKSMTCYKCTTSEEVNTKTISKTCMSEEATSNCSKQGNGYAKITYIGK